MLNESESQRGSNLTADCCDMSSPTLITQIRKIFGLYNELNQKCSLPISIHSYFNTIHITIPPFLLFTIL